MSTSKKISVLLPVYNAQDFIFESIDSILKQTFEDFELLIFNDGSTDKSKEIIHSINDKRIIYLENTTNKGIVYNLNKGIYYSKGDYIARMDADDIAFKNRFEKQFYFLENEREIDILATGLQVLGTNSISIKEFSPDFHKIYLLKGNTVAHPTVMIRKKSLTSIGLKYDSQALYVEDYKLWLDACLNNLKIHSLSEVLLYYRSHTNQISKKKFNQQVNNSRLLKFLYAHYYFEPYLNGKNAELYIQFIENCIPSYIEKEKEIDKLCTNLVKEVKRNRIFNLDLFNKFLDNQRNTVKSANLDKTWV